MSARADIEALSGEIDRLREVLLMALVVALPISVGVVVWSPPGGDADFTRRVSIGPLDVPLALLLVLTVVDRRALVGQRINSGTSRIAIGLGIVLAVAFVVHPSPRGVDLALRVLAGLAVIRAMRLLDHAARQRILGAIVIVGGFEATVALAASARGAALGLGPVEDTGYVFSFGTSTAAHASFDHPYHLACFLLVALGAALVGALRGQRRSLWLVGAGLVAAGLATTYSRAALVTLVIVLGIVLISRGVPVEQRTRRQFAAVVIGAFLVAAVSFGNGWVVRGQATANRASADSDRSVRAREALRLLRDQPMFGVGPGRYTNALESIPHTDLFPAHDVVLHEAAEGGILAGILTAALLLTLWLRALRRGPESTAVFAALALFFILDAYPYVFPSGIALSALWLGVQELATRDTLSQRHAARDGAR